MRQLILGVDGGGTKSHLVIFDNSGNCLLKEHFGALNHEVMKGSYDEFKRVFTEFLLGSLKKINAGVNDVAHAVFGLAGVDTEAQHSFVSRMLRALDFPAFTLCNDGFAVKSKDFTFLDIKTS